MGTGIENKVESARPAEARVAPSAQKTSQQEKQQRKIIIVVSIAALVILGSLIAGVVVLAQPSTDTARVRDIFIILMALESLLLGVSLIILIVQLARLMNLLQNEIKPILESTNETINTLRGTTVFISDNLVEPVIKLNSYLAALTQFFDILNLSSYHNKSKTTNTQ